MKHSFIPICLCLSISSCGNTLGVGSRISTAGTVQFSDLPPNYQASIDDALNPEPSEVVHDLIAIAQSNPQLEWREFDDKAYVNVATVVGDARYYKADLNSWHQMAGHYVWVTTSPELQSKCIGFDQQPTALIQRVREILGLAPNSPISDVVSFWVMPENLFRPAADNEITDSTAGLSLPENTAAWYRKWFNELRSKQYFESDAPPPGNTAYPWTQLGYTYDWGSDQHPPQGLSEFVINANSTVFVEAITKIEDYCANTN